MASFFSINSASFVTNKNSCGDIFGWCGTFYWNGSEMVFRSDNHSKISGLQVNFFQCFTKHCSLPARGKLLTFTFGNKFHTSRCICLNWCNETISGKFPPKSGRGKVSLVKISSLLCFFLTKECFCRRKLPFCCIFLPGNLLFLYPWLKILLSRFLAFASAAALLLGWNSFSSTFKLVSSCFTSLAWTSQWSSNGYISWIVQARKFVPTCIWTVFTNTSFPEYNWDILPILQWLLFFDWALIITISPIFTSFVLSLWLRLSFSKYC